MSRILLVSIAALAQACQSAPHSQTEFVDLRGSGGGPVLLARVEHAGQALETRGQLQTLSFGSQLQLELVELGAAEAIFVVDTLLPTRRFDAALPGWRAPALHPVWGIVLTEYKNPPRLPPYLRWLWIDPVTGDVQELGRHPGVMIDAVASLSSDGRWLAFADAGQRLCVLDLVRPNPLSRCLDAAPRGQRPLFQPGGVRLLFGGVVVDTEGRVVDALDGFNPGALGRWSPDGTSLSLRSQKTWIQYPQPVGDAGLLIHNQELRKRLTRLADLYRQGLVDIEVYRQRRDRIRASREVRP